MRIDEKAAARLLEGQDDFLILTHGHPDGDTLGCAFALCRGLQKCSKRARVECTDEIPAKFSYLWREVEQEAFAPRFFVAVDVADPKLLGKRLEERYAAHIDLCIDHHGSNTLYAAQTLLDASAGAACEVIYEVLRELGVEMDEQIADCIYTGLSTDTGCFRYSNATARTHRIAADMIDCGADAPIINQVMFETKTRTYAALERLALDSLETYCNGRAALITVTQEMYRLSGSNESECDPIASLPRQIEGVLVGAMLREKADGTFKASVRTHRPVDAAELCKRMGGGGHPRAAGCQLEGPLECAKKVLLQQIRAVLEA